ncbi:TPA: hypothetical protein RZC51_001575 [Burkholderia cenocepacia]|nr:hypothetical protein [Burkholderia cenocepacia]
MKAELVRVLLKLEMLQMRASAPDTVIEMNERDRAAALNVPRKAARTIV